MRFKALLIMVLLSACASVPTPATPGAARTASNAVARTNLLAAAGSANAPTRAEIERAFGQPDIARQDGAGAALTYRLPSCALLLVFEADARNTFRLADAHASARRTGEGAPSLEQCATEALARR